MKVIYNNTIPVKGFKAINICGVLFVRNGCVMGECDMNHEKIHSAQVKEMIVLGFYIWYITEWCFRYIQYRNSHIAYRNISFEREAYDNQFNLNYLSERKMFSFLRYL